MGRFGSCLCPTWNWLDQIGWSKFQLAPDRSGWLDRANPTFNKWRLVWLELDIWKSVKIWRANSKNWWNFDDIFTGFGKISLDSARSRQIQWDLAKFGGNFMDLAEIFLEMAEISLDLKHLAGKCFISQSGRVSSGFGKKIRDQTNNFGFWRTRPAVDHRSSKWAVDQHGFSRIYRVGQATD